MSEAPKKRGKIRYPEKDKSTGSRRFAAFGTVDKGTWLIGELLDSKDKKVAEGRIAYFAPSKQDSSQMLWILCFDARSAQDSHEKYTLRICDKMGGHIIDEVRGIDLKCHGYGEIDFPPSGASGLPLQFPATGTAPAGGHVSGTMTNCNQVASDIEEIDPPPDWTLLCSIVDPNPPCTLTVKYDGEILGVAENLGIGE